ncbi:MAG: RNA methyltransferase [Bacteroidales bacterium]|nr:RNA methyltransferase [Candidatus Scybalocola fimicaballi]
MISKNQIKFVYSFGKKKTRDEHQLFLAEGVKILRDILPYFEAEFVCATDEAYDEIQSLTKTHVEKASEAEIEKMTQLQSAPKALALLRMPERKLDFASLSNSLVLALDGVQDPGNVGTILRIADWFGIRTVLCSQQTADIYNPKTIQATMGAIARVSVSYVDLPSTLQTLKSQYKMPIYGTFLDGKNMYDTDLTTNGVIVMGNEGNGVTPEIDKMSDHRLYIPNYPVGSPTSESLNVSVATAIVCAEFRRR